MSDQTTIQRLLARYYDNTLTAAEFDELFGLLKENENDFQTELRNLLIHRAAVQGQNFVYRKEEWKSMINTIVDAAPDQQSVPVRSIYWRKWIAAASVILILVSVGYYIADHRIAKNNSIAYAGKPSTDAAPGSNKAFLTLANGQQIILDSAHNGLIATQGRTNITKLSNGQLDYISSARATSAIVLNTMTTPRGGQYQLRLPDGTMVWLNAASSITFPTVFADSQREVSATGEIYFEVAQDARRPFKVKLPSGSEINVLGTHFNINTYTDEPVQKITLLEGRIAVAQNHHSSALRPGQQAQINGSVQIRDNVDISEVMAWKNGKFRFRDNDIQSIMRQVSRWYDLDVVYGSEIPSGHYNGEPSRNLTAMQMLKLVEYSGVKVRIQGRRVIIGNEAD